MPSKRVVTSHRQFLESKSEPLTPCLHQRLLLIFTAFDWISLASSPDQRLSMTLLTRAVKSQFNQLNVLSIIRQNKPFLSKIDPDFSIKNPNM